MKHLVLQPIPSIAERVRTAITSARQQGIQCDTILVSKDWARGLLAEMSDRATYETGKIAEKPHLGEWTRFVGELDGVKVFESLR